MAIIVGSQGPTVTLLLMEREKNQVFRSTGLAAAGSLAHPMRGATPPVSLEMEPSLDGVASR